MTDLRTAFVLAIGLLSLTGCSAAASRAPETARSSHDEPSYREEFVVGGHVRGLEGIGLTLRSANGESVTVDDDGKFVFHGRLENWSEYEVTIAREPISPVQSCVVERGVGRINGKNAMTVEVSCKTASFDDAADADAKSTLTFGGLRPPRPREKTRLATLRSATLATR